MLESLSLAQTVLLFAVSSAVVGYSGSRLSRDADALADLTKLGEAFFGMLLLGGATSLAGIVTSMTAAHADAADLSYSNAIGGIIVQSVFLAVADACLPRINLEHAAASIENVMHGLLLVILLAIMTIVMAGPDVKIAHIHIGSFVLLGSFLVGLRIIRSSRGKATWSADSTPETAENVSVPEESLPDQRTLWISFAAHTALIVAAGFLVARTSIQLMEFTGISGTVIGFILTGFATSLPELITSIAAVRQRALNLAVGGIVGGNAFEVLLLPLSDMSYGAGSLYHALDHQHFFLAGMAILMNAVLLLGLIRRQRKGPGNIGFESAAILGLYILSAGVIVRWF